MDIGILSSCSVFKGVDLASIDAVLHSAAAREKTYAKGSYVYRQGDVVKSMGIVLEGRVRIESTDVWGNTNLIGSGKPGSVFAETYAAVRDTPLMVDVVADDDCRIVFLDVARILAGDGVDDATGMQVTRNLVLTFAQKNLGLSRRIMHSTPKTIRARLVSYLSYEAAKHGSNEFDIPYDRQRLADYLSVDRSALSSEIGKMQREGLLDARRSHFILKSPLE